MVHFLYINPSAHVQVHSKISFRHGLIYVESVFQGVLKSGVLQKTTMGMIDWFICCAEVLANTSYSLSSLPAGIAFAENLEEMIFTLNILLCALSAELQRALLFDEADIRSDFWSLR